MNMLKYPFDDKQDHYQGSTCAPIELMLYGDFQCKHCGQAYPEIKLLIDKLGSRIKFVYRHYPIPIVHSLALEAAMASEAAASQGKFWYMHDMIFENQEYLLRSSFSGFAEEIGLDMQQYENSKEHKKLKYKVINDYESGVKCDVDATPTFFINGKKYNGYNDFEGLYRACMYTSFYLHELPLRKVI
jgi:protein-disulfide isomerase